MFGLGIGVIGFAAFTGLVVFLAMCFRVVVPTNEVHIVQTGGATTSFGKGQQTDGKLNGNVYYAWPSWVPVFGITRTIFPTSIFDVDLKNYEAYDSGRLPFAVDVKAFFQIENSNEAAQKVASFEELASQLTAVVQGAIRVVLGGQDIEHIMAGRSTLGEAFTNEVKGQLGEWGVKAVKNIELMDLRDGQNGHAIKSIMEKKKSLIDAESRTEVAKNNQNAQIAEIDAKRQVDLQKQEAEQRVGLRTAEAQREVEIAKQRAVQAVKEAEKVTQEKHMEVERVKAVKAAEIEKDKALVKADQDRKTVEIKALADLEKARREAEGVQAQGLAQAEATKANEQASVQAQITLAKEIGENKGYQDYLVTIEQVKANQAVGIAQAAAIEKANIKVIANTGNVTEGVKSVSELFSSKGGVAVGAMLEGLANTDTGKALLTKAGLSSETLN